MAVAGLLGERDAKVLEAVVEEFVQSAEPVGSRFLTKRHSFGISPATIRNVMADLEELGFLVQPHTSAGRKPTDKGYRYYVDHLMSSEPLAVPERRRIRKQIGAGDAVAFAGVLDAASRALSAVAHQVGVVIAPRFESSVFRRIDFVKIRDDRVLVILVSQAGVVHNRLVAAPEIRSQSELDQMANYLNEFLRDVPLQDVKERILTEMATAKAAYDSFVKAALELGRTILEESSPAEGVYVADPSTLFGQPEFSSVEQLRSLFEAFEKKGMILKLLERASAADGIQIYIGDENPVPDLRSCAVVSAAFGADTPRRGTVGIIGPTRMDYGKVVGLVEYTAQLLSEMMASL